MDELQAQADAIARRDRIAETMREIQRDCEQDASTVDSTPFTGKGVGETFGNVLAMLSVVARGVELLAEGQGA